mmetsp:Transcript_11045/g.10712  ORF Transcript_11045/g.10712 Transcript_11045/m.10712 type:complete len:396 (-) Transcript_11045:57-1244(-)
MRQSNNAKSLVTADREAIRQALAILEEEGVNIINDNTLDIPSTTTTKPTINNSNTSIGDRLKKKIQLQKFRHKQQNHALLSPTRSKATRRASVTAYNSNSKHLQLEESSSNSTESTADHHQQNHALLSPSRSKATRRASVKAFNSNFKLLQLEESSSNITEATADLDSCASNTSYEESSSSSGTTSNSSSKKLDKNKKVDGKAKRKKNTKRSKSRQQRQSRAPKSKKEEDNNNNGNGSSSTGVRFSKHEQIEYIPHINDLSQTEIDSIWMKEDEYDTIRKRSLRLVEMIEDPQKRYPISNDTMIVNTHLICVRGLCDMTTHCVEARDAVQQQLQTAVFRLQESQQQQDNKMGDGQGADHTQATQALRQVSRKYSKKSTKAARFVGISDRVTISIK